MEWTPCQILQCGLWLLHLLFPPNCCCKHHVTLDGTQTNEVITCKDYVIGDKYGCVMCLALYFRIEELFD